MKGLTEQLADSDDRADLTPMIDCVFLLLLFFIVTAAFVQESNLFKVELPRASEAEVRQVKDVCVVSVSEAGQYSMDAGLVAEGELWSRLSRIHETTPIRTFVIKGDRNCPYEKVVTVLDMAQTLRIDDISLAVDTEAAR